MNFENFIMQNGEREYRNSKIYGVVTAIVTNNKDPEKLGRIKVKFPWLAEAEEDESAWARIALFMGGNEMGSFFLPEIDDEVLVAFEHGDIHFPYIMGALWNGKQKPHQSNENGKNDIREFKSRSGHKITFDDKEGEEKIIIMDKGEKRKIELLMKDKSINIINDEDGGGISITSKGDINIESRVGKINMTSKKDITIKSGAKLVTEATKDFSQTSSSGKIIVESKTSNIESSATNVKITAKQNFECITTAGIKLESKGTADFKGGMVSVEAKAINSLKGKIVEIDATALAGIKGKVIQVDATAALALAGKVVKIN